MVSLRQLRLILLLLCTAGCTLASQPETTLTVIVAVPSATNTASPVPTVTPSLTPTQTATLFPTATPPPPTLAPLTEAPLPTSTPGVNGQVSTQAEGLRLRTSPDPNGFVLTNLKAGTPLIISLRTPDGVWLRVTTPQGETGWVMAQYVDAQVNLAALDVYGTDKGGVTQAASLVYAANVGNSASGPTAEVLEVGDGLRLRQGPGLSSKVVERLPKGSSLTIVGRTGDNSWLQVVAPDGANGWVWGAYLKTPADLSSVPITGTPEPTAAPPPVVVGISGVSANARQIFLKGQSLGNRPNVFSKVGDSLTVATYVLYPFSWGKYDLHDYGYLQAALEFFSAATARTANSFGNISLSADNGWTTGDVLNPGKASPGICQPGESPLVCEYRTVKPSAALILLGTNDVSAMSSGDYAANLTVIVQTSMDMGVIPVLTTIPTRLGYEGQSAQFNQVIIGTAHNFDIPLIDYGSAMQNLPNGGLSADGVHPSWPPGDYSAAADLSLDNLRYGYTLRNLLLLEMLDALYRQVLY